MKERKLLQLLIAIQLVCISVFFGCHVEAEERNQLIHHPISPIHTNQLGYHRLGFKIAVISETESESFALFEEEGTEAVYEGKLTLPESWSYSNEMVRVADFTSFQQAGTYYIKVPSVGKSYSFTIGDHVFDEVHTASLKAFYYQRSSIGLLEKYAGKWMRPFGHPDDSVLLHRSAWVKGIDSVKVISAPCGWYDAGDYGKYVPNAGFSTHTLLSLYEDFPQVYDTLILHIPESINALPDILDEVKWSLRWLMKMQEPQTGAVYHKLTTLNFIGRELPHEDQTQRFMIGKSTGAALNLAIVMAKASRIYASFEDSFADSCLSIALKAWKWANSHTNMTFENPTNVSTGEYSDTNFQGEFDLAAVELFLATEEDSFLQASSILSHFYDRPPEWVRPGILTWIALLNHKKELASKIDTNSLKNKFIAYVDRFAQHANKISAYRVPIGESEWDFVWGSNGITANHGRVLTYAYGVTQDPKYLKAAISVMDYLAGRNPLSICYITGFGHVSPLDIHHRLSASDTVNAPIPGLLVGGPFDRNNPDNCDYPGNSHATRYLDSWCSFSTNEVAINWQSSFAYFSGALRVALKKYVSDL